MNFELRQRGIVLTRKKAGFSYFNYYQIDSVNVEQEVYYEHFDGLPQYRDNYIVWVKFSTEERSICLFKSKYENDCIDVADKILERIL